MNKKSYVVAAITVFVLMSALGWLLHSVVLNELYEMTNSVWRDEVSRGGLKPIMFFNYFVVSFVFAYLFTRGHRNKGWAEGVRFGLIFGLVMATSGAIEKFVMLDVPLQLALGWFMGTLFTYMILGLFNALIYTAKD